MAWWRNFAQQANELLQQILYSLELAVAGGEDAPWIDTLNFLWDSLPDADKLTTAERRRLAHRMKQIVREQVHKHYTQELAQKEAIHERQTTREALAHKHLQQLADARQRQMQALAETARQQSMMRLEDLVPDMVQGNSLWTPFDSTKSSPSPWPLLPNQWQQQLGQPPQRQAMPGRVVRISLRNGQGQQQQQQQYRAVSRTVSAGSSNSGGSSTRLQRPSSSHVVLNISDGDSSSNSGNTAVFEGFAGRCLGVRTGLQVADEDLQQPLLHSPKSPFAAAQQQQTDTLRDTQQQQQQQGQYEPPKEDVSCIDQLQLPHLSSTVDLHSNCIRSTASKHVHPHPQHVVSSIATKQQQHNPAPAGPADMSPLGSHLLLERYLTASSGHSSAADTGLSAASAAALAGCESLRCCSAGAAGSEPPAGVCAARAILWG